MSERVPTVMVGDWNLTPATVSDIADAIGGRLVMGRGPDHAVVRGCRVVGVTRVRDKHGSDHHHPIVLDLEVGGHALRILYWNVYGGNSAAQVRPQLARLIDEWRPTVVQLSEAYKLRQVLATVPGYKRFQGPNVREGADVAMLVRSNVKVLRKGTLRMRRSWVGPLTKNRRGPRRYKRMRLQLAPGVRVRVLGVHFPPGPRVNAAAVAESRQRVISWANAS